MQLESRMTWEKLLVEIRALQADDHASVVSLLLGTNAVIWPREEFEASHRQIHYLTFELCNRCDGLSLAEKWEKLRQFFFEKKEFRITPASWSEIRNEDLLLKPILENHVGHPLPVTLIFFHLALAVGLPASIVQARQQFIVKICGAGFTSYIDILQNGRILDDREIFHLLQKSSTSPEVWDARSIFRRYLEEMMRLFEQLNQSSPLHTVYNICLHLDEANLPVLARRALLRHRMGFAREALTDLKRYFSFVDRGHAPIELQKAMLDLEMLSDEPNRHDILH